MPVKTVLFDLDGTLLPMDQEIFVNAYFKRLVQKLAPHGYAPDQTVKAIWRSTASVIQNDGSSTNEQLFWKGFASIFGPDCVNDIPVFDAFYRNEFQEVAKDCGFEPKAAILIDMLKQKGCRLVLATNPIFPAVATESRIRWAGLNKDDFELVTTYENSRYCKPNPAYYREILDKLNLNAEECLMVGNDVGDDMVAQSLGMKVFLLTDCLINNTNADISCYPNGNFDDLMAFLS